MENLSLGENATVSVGTGLVHDAVAESSSVSQSQVHKIEAENIGSSQHSARNYAEPSYSEHGNKRARPWRGRWSYHYTHYIPETDSHRENIDQNPNPPVGNYGHAHNGYYRRGSFSSRYPAERRMEQRWSNHPHMHDRFTRPKTHVRDNLNYVKEPQGYNEHMYHGWNNRSTEQHQSRYCIDRDRVWTNLGSRTASYDTQQLPFSNDYRRGHTWNRDGQQRHMINDRHPKPWVNNRDMQGLPWINDRQHQPPINDSQQPPGTNDRQHRPLINDSQQPPWTNDQQRQPWTNNRQPHSQGNRTSPYRYHRQGSYRLQNGARQSGIHGREQLNDMPSTYYNSRNGLRPRRFPASEDDRTYHGGGEKLEHELQQEIKKSSVDEQTTITRAPSTCLKRKLLILDVNGLLADVIFPPPKEDKADINICRRAIFKRPYVDDFLKFCFDRFNVAVWSSRTTKILDKVVEYLFGDMKSKLLFCWDQSHCTKSGFKTLENKNKELLLKEIKNVWEKCDATLPWEKGDYDESNTLLLDDSPYKALLNPMHTAIFPQTYSYKDKSDKSLGPEGDLRVYLQGLSVADHMKRYVEEHPFGQRPIDETCPSWAFYLEVIMSKTRLQTPVQPQIESVEHPQIKSVDHPQIQSVEQPHMQFAVEPQIE